MTCACPAGCCGRKDATVASDHLFLSTFCLQAQVYLTTWRAHPEVDSRTITPGDCVAIKHIRTHSGGGRFQSPQSQWDMDGASKRGGHAHTLGLFARR